MFTMPELRVGDPARHEALTVYPLFSLARPDPSPRYHLSAEALSGGAAVVEEVSDGGSVPHLSVTVADAVPVLFLEGEELAGAKQNRVLNTSVLVPGSSKTMLPVSCVERGRWRYASKTFDSSGKHSSSKLRKVLKASVGRSARGQGARLGPVRRLGRGRPADGLARLGVADGRDGRHLRRLPAAVGRVPRQAGLGLADKTSRDRKGANLSPSYPLPYGRGSSTVTVLSRCPYQEEAVGLVAALGGRVVALDVFDAPSTCEKVWARLLTGLVMDAVEEAAAQQSPNVKDALDAFRCGPWAAVPAAGAGEEYRSDLAGGAWHASALSLDGRLLHGSLVAAG